MREKLQSLDRNIIALIIIAVVVIFGLAQASNQSPAKDAPEQTAATSDEQSEEHNDDDGHTHEEGEDAAHDEKENKDSEGEHNESTQGGDYSYTAQSGDSYTTIARKAVQTYGIRNNVNLSEAQIIYAETMLTQNAQAPLLELGENVTFNEESLRNTVDRAQDLTNDEESNWDYYVQFVDFNTDSVGETRS